jgi:hypothetical protein
MGHVIKPEDNNMSLGEEKVKRANIQHSLADISSNYKKLYAQQMVNKSPMPILFIPTKQIGIASESFKTQGINY